MLFARRMKLCCQDELLETDDKYYQVAETSVKDKSMLGTHGQQLCDNVDVYWTVPTCSTAKNITGCKYNVFRKSWNTAGLFQNVAWIGDGQK